MSIEEVKSLGTAESVDLANFMILMHPSIWMECHYTNYKGETRLRRFVPGKFWYGTTVWHPEPCLLLKARDLDKDVLRDFRVADFDLTTLRRSSRREIIR